MEEPEYYARSIIICSLAFLFKKKALTQREGLTETMTQNAAGPWIEVSEREPECNAVVLGEWQDGCVCVVEWKPKSFEGQRELGHRPGDVVMHSIYLLTNSSMVMGFKEWPVRWAELFPKETP